MDALFRMEHHVEQQQAYGCEDDVVAGQHLDPEPGIALAGEDRSRWPAPCPAAPAERSEKESAAAAIRDCGCEWRARRRRFRWQPAPTCPAGSTSANSHACPCDAQVVHDEKDGASAICTMVTKMKLARTLARKSCAPELGAMRCASITWWRISRAHAWLSALTEANIVATQSTPPAIVLGKRTARIKRHGEQHHHEQREEQHGVDGVFASATRCAGLWRDGSRGCGVSCGVSLRSQPVAPSLIRSAVLALRHRVPARPSGSRRG